MKYISFRIEFKTTKRFNLDDLMFHLADNSLKEIDSYFEVKRLSRNKYIIDFEYIIT